MISSAIFMRYAHALADVALQSGDEPAVRRGLDTFRAIFREVPALLDSLDSPAVRREAKDKVLSDLIALYPTVPMVHNFLRILLDHHRIRYFEEIADAYAITVDERRGIIGARVVSASPLSDADQRTLGASLTRALGKEIKLTAGIDPELIGGVVVQIGSTVYDGSIRTQLMELRKRLGRE